MSEYRMDDQGQRRLTPWVGRLLAANAVVLLLQQTLFTSNALTGYLAFNSARVSERPWTVFTYMFVHAGLLHLAGNSLALFVFGPLVERRLGSGRFIAYYFYCGVAAAVVAFLLHSVGLGYVPDGPDYVGILGASGAIIGVVYAYSRIAPDSQLMVFPLPVPIRAQVLVALLAAYDLVGLLFLHDGIAHEAHLGGLLAGALYFVLRGISRPPLTSAISSPPRPRMQVAAGSDRHQSVAGTSRRTAPGDGAAQREPAPDETAEIDRVLDKISATGIESLTAEERKFLDSVARRRRDLPH